MIDEKKLAALQELVLLETQLCTADRWAKVMHLYPEVFRLARLGLEYEAKELWVIDPHTNQQVKYRDQYFFKLAKWAEQHAIPALKNAKYDYESARDIPGSGTNWGNVVRKCMDALAALPKQ